ncbi:amino acid adenylation domain-containing protein [Actinomycetospora lutea]|uniref:non-ribosomal peptide synthetase n=1 Tax=Actinomycetospora lutea TaxID=663604 RepID=UPI002365C82F|nr:non-ribosomal peptide synthetase [Actinomycetospora lutea]MDD7940431.1 amino acid adenylation domain-containing protein [Actinomycetospora lutea]
MSTAVQAPRTELLELTGAQLGIWNAQWLEPDSPHYLVGDVVEIDGERTLDVGALAESVRRTADEAETLHLRFHDTPDGPRQTLTDEPPAPPEVVDLRAEADPVAAAHAAVAAIRTRAAEACRGLVDRRLDSQTLLRLSDRAVWWVQLYHHVIIDGYSAAMMARRAAAHYTALVRGTEPPAPGFGAIADLVTADQEYRAGERFERDRAYWRDRLTPLPEPTGAARTASGAPQATVAASVVVPPATVARLKAAGERSATTWADVLIACFAAFLHRAHGESDVVIGMPLMCRVGKAALRTPAMAVNLLPLRVEVRGDDGLDALSARVAERMKEMRSHQRFRGADLPRELGVPGLGGMLLGGINLKAFDYTIDFAGSTGVMRNVAGGPPQDYELTATPTADGGLRLGFEVDDRLTDQRGVEWRAHSLLRVVDALTAPAAPAVGAVALTSADERAQLLADWTGPAAGAPDDVTTAIDRLAERGDRTALVCGAERLTAAELAARVHRTARALRARGIGTDDVVAVALPRSVDLVVTLLAALDAGAAYLPLDLAHPTARLRELIADARPALVVATGSALEAAVDVDALRAEADAHPATPPADRSLAPERLAYVIYTSGSTGRPKGVLVRAGGLSGLLAHHPATAPELAGRGVLRVAHTYSFAFDASIDQLLWLLHGHELHLYDADLTRDAEELLATFGADGIDVVDTTPSMATQLIDSGLLTGAHPPALLILGGEATPPALWARVVDAGVPARNVYGPTEASVDATAAPLTPGVPTIGTGLPGTRVYLLDVALQPVPHGAVGELYLAGPHLARGYLGHPGTTAERFLADPYGAPGERMYRTGDLARWVPGRGLDYLGRGDGQVKIRGYRIEIGEVEGQLADLPGVRAAAALVRTDTGRPQLVGYVVGPEVGSVTPDGVRRALAARVPEHMVPSAVVVLDELPTTTSGKLDRRALPASAGARSGRAAETPSEKALASVLADVLDLERVAVEDDFVGLGGDSITAIAVCSRLRAHGLELRPRELLAAPDLASLATLARRSTEHEALPDVTVDPAAVDFDGPIREALPATALQAGLTVHSLARQDTDAEVYLVQGVHHLTGEIDPARLEAAAAELLRRSPALRSALTTAATGEVVQVVPEEVELGWAHVDVAGRDDAEQAVAAAARAEMDRPWHPARPPLIRFVLLTLGAADHRLVITNHHALLDGWSMPLVCRTLFAIYDELGGGTPAPVPAPVTDYLRWLARQDRAASLAAWRRQLAGIDEGTRLAPAARNAGLERPARRQLELDGALSDDVRAFARARGITLATVVQTAWGLLLARLTGRHDVLFGTPVSGRSGQVDGIETMIGQLGNTVVVRLTHRDRDTAEQVLAAMHEQSVAMTDHHHAGLAEVQRAVGVGDLFDTLVVTENLPMSARTGVTLAPGVQLDGVDTDDGTHYPLNIVVLPEQRIVLRFGYQPSAFDDAAVRDIGERLRTLLRDMVDHPDRAVSRLRLLEPEQEAAVLAAGTEHVARHRVRAGCLEEFAAQVRRRPDQAAVECRDRVLTYAELDRRADRLAHALLARGVRPEQPVAVLLRRDVEMVVAVFGIFKAGAVYVPMDPDHPRERLEYMVGDAHAVAAVTTAAVHAGLPVADDVPVLRLDDPELLEGPGPHEDTDPVDARRGLTADALAYVIYTSGTTGRPKGVAVSHSGFPGLVALQEDVVGVGEERYLHFASTGFDVAVWQMMLPLLSGGTSVIAPEEVRLPGPELLDYAAEHRVTGLNLLPSFLAAMPADAQVDPDVFMVVGAERLDPALARRWGDGRRALFNAYGPTEVTINAVTWRYDPAEPALDTDEGTLPIGRPDPDVRAYVLGSGLRPVGIDMVGELYLAGPGLARGYLGLPGQTAGAFVADPFGPPGERMYRTGDRVRRRADGQLVYLGRTDDQVKVRGVRIEPAEIEAALARHPAVRAGVVDIRDDRLVGYVVPVDGAQIDPAALRADLAAVLPTAMVPTALVALDRLPLGPSGKLDRGALPAPEHGATPSRAPSTPAESVLLGVLREVLENDAVELDDEFVDVGGDSIVSLALVSRARRRGVELSVRDVLEGGTVAGIAARATVGPPGDDRPAALDLPRSHVLPLRRAGTAAPLFCVHPAGGFATVFTGLVRELPADRPVIGLQLPSLDGAAVTAPTIDELAAEYLGTIRGIQPAGPYHLLGYSFGGNVVHALAAQLVAAGEEVAFTGLIDSGPLAAERADGRGPDADAVEAELRAALPPGAAQEAPELVETVRAAVEQTVAIRSASHAPRYDGVLTLFAAAQGAEGDGAQLAAAWRELVGAERIVAHHVEGDHAAIVAPRGWAAIGPVVARALA